MISFNKDRKKAFSPNNGFFSLLLTLCFLINSPLIQSGDTESGGGTTSSGKSSENKSGINSGENPAGSCGDQFNKKSYLSPELLASGSFGTTFKVEQASGKKLALKVSECSETRHQKLWQYENQIYQGLSNRWPGNEQYLKLIVKRESEPFTCKGSIESWNNLSETKKNAVNCANQCCVTAIEYVSGPRLTEYIKKQPSGKMPLTSNEPKAWLFQISFALFAAFVDTGFQHWDLKTDNIMTSPYPTNTVTQCFSWRYQKKLFLKCFDTKLTNKSHIKLIDFDRSTLGRTELERVGGDSHHARKDPGKLIEICVDLYDNEKCKADVFKDLISQLNKLFDLTPGSLNKSLPDKDYINYAKGFHSLLNSSFFDSLFKSESSCDANCVKHEITNQTWADEL